MLGVRMWKLIFYARKNKKASKELRRAKEANELPCCETEGIKEIMIHSKEHNKEGEETHKGNKDSL